MIDLPEDFRDLLVGLHDAGAEFVVLGGHAVAYYGRPQATEHLDVLIRADHDNAAKVYAALGAFGLCLAELEIKVEDFAAYDGVLQIGLPPRRIDIVSRADGITFDGAVEDGECFEVDRRAIPIIGRRALLKNLRATGRAQDLADVIVLERLAKPRR
jgi:hypothetical protein